MHADANSQEMDYAVEQAIMRETSKPCRSVFLWFTLSTLWLLLSSLTSAGFIMAFYNDIMFRFCFIAFSWFITITSLPFILRPILKSLSLYYEEMDKFRNKCVYLLNRLMYIIFIWINCITTFLLLADNTGRYWSAGLVIGFHNVILAFKLGSFLSFRLSSSKFHGTHFLFLCLASATAIYLNHQNTENGMLIFAPLLLHGVEFCVLVVVQSSMRRKQVEYHNREKHRKHVQQKQKQRVIELSDINVDVSHIQRGQSSVSPSPVPYRNAAALSLRLNRDKKTEQDLFKLHEGDDFTVLQDRVRVYSEATQSIKTEELTQLRYRKTRHVTCCCSKLICGLRTCLQMQTIVTAVSIWGSFAMFLLNKVSWTCYALMIFISATTIYNPICYTKRCFKIRQDKSCCTADKCCLCCAYFFGLIVVLIAACLCALLFVIANPFVVSDIDEAVVHLDDRVDAWWTLDLVSVEFKLRLMYSVWGIAALSFLNYLPGAGWVFYQTPLSFGLINLLSFLICLIVPLILNNAFNTESDPCTELSDFTCRIQKTSVIHVYDFIYNGYSNRLEETDANDQTLLYIPHLTALISFTIYLSLTGLGCSWYRFKKAIVESQAKLTGNIKGQQSKEFGMTLIMASTLTLAFGDVISDAVYAFGTKDEEWASPSLKWLTIGLFSMQIFIQIFSFNDVINQLRKSLSKHQSLPGCGWCYNHCELCYRVLTLPYLIIVLTIGIVLGLTKLFSIKQVQEWWFKLLISGYKKEVQKADEIERQKQELEKEDVEVVVDVAAEKELQLGQQMAVSSASESDVQNVLWKCSNCGELNVQKYVTCSTCFVDRNAMKMPPSGVSMNAPRPMMNIDNDNEGTDMNQDESTSTSTSTSTSSSGDQNVAGAHHVDMIAQSVDNHQNMNQMDVNDVQKATVDNANQLYIEQQEIAQDNIHIQQEHVQDVDTHQNIDNDQSIQIDNPWGDDMNIGIHESKDNNDNIHKTGAINDTNTNANAEIQDLMQPSMNAVDNAKADISKLKMNIAAEVVDVDEDYNEDPPTPVRQHSSKQSSQFQNIVTMVLTKSAKKLPGIEEQRFESDTVQKKQPITVWNDFQLNAMESQSVRSFKPSAPSDDHKSKSVRNFNAVLSKSKSVEEDIAVDIVHTVALKGSAATQSQSVRRFKPLEQDVSADRERAQTERTFKHHAPLNEAGGGIRDITTPKMAKFRAKYHTSDSADPPDSDAFVLDNSDEAKSEEIDDIKENKEKKSKEDRKANILEDGQWLGYEISSGSLLWKIYLWIDSFTPLWMSRLKVRANVYNSYFISELIIESWPQLVTNLVNSYYQGFSSISYISASFSLLMISHTMLKIIYYVGVRNKDLETFVL